MKNLLIYINPRKDFDEEGKVAIKIQIDNSLYLGWERADILLITNFPYKYRGVKALVIGDANYCDHWPWSTKTYCIAYLFKHNLIKEDEVYWAHDMDVFQNEAITKSEVESEMGDLGLTDRGINPKWAMGSIFFKSSAKDIFMFTQDIMHKFKIDEETAIWILTGHSGGLDGEKTKLVNAYIENNLPEIKNFNKRVKKMNFSYNFAGWNLPLCFELATKPIKMVHFHFSIDLDLDSYMYGKNSLHLVLMPERLIKIFHKHGVKGVFPKIMKNLMVYISPEKRFLGESESLVKQQIDNSFNMGWKKEDIILVTNFPYEYQGIKSKVLDDKINKSDVIFHLLTEGVVKEAELWWYHDLDVFQVQPMDSSQIDLEDTTSGFTDNGFGSFETGSFFFRKDSDKIFEWTRNRAIRLRSDETVALMSLVNENYRNINNMYKKLDGKKMATIFSKTK